MSVKRIRTLGTWWLVPVLCFTEACMQPIEDKDHGDNTSLQAQSQAMQGGWSWQWGTATFYGVNDECSRKDWNMPGPASNAGTCNGSDGNEYALYEKTYYAAVADGNKKLMMGPMCYCPCGETWENGYKRCAKVHCQQDYPKCPKQNSCNRCIEVRCKSELSGKQACFEQLDGKFRSVVVRVSDACPAFHPNNPPGSHCTKSDTNHIDVSCAAMNDLSDLYYGQWQIDWRYVSCDAGVGFKQWAQDQYACSYDGWQWICPHGQGIRPSE